MPKNNTDTTPAPKYKIGDKVTQIVTHLNGFTVRTGKVTVIKITKDEIYYTINFEYGIFPVVDSATQSELFDKKELRMAVSCLLDTCINHCK